MARKHTSAEFRPCASMLQRMQLKVVQEFSIEPAWQYCPGAWLVSSPWNSVQAPAPSVQTSQYGKHQRGKLLYFSVSLKLLRQTTCWISCACDDTLVL
eukprot:4380032-Amphidinium_carterae.1